MKSTFGQKLFRLFLLFALIPALILTAVGYYLASQEKPTIPASQSEPTTALTDYYNRYLFDIISSGKSLDFIIRIDDDRARVIESSLELSPDAVEKIAGAAISRPHGFVLIDSAYYQYAVLNDGSSDRRIGGLVHDRPYLELAEVIQTDIGATSSQRILSTEYVTFLALLFVVLVLITGFLAYYFSARISRNLARPLTRLSAASIAIAEGNFDQHVDATAAGEIKTLIGNFNRMARQLQMTTERLAQTERVAAWRSVARRFAHELKNPLQPILVSIFRLENALKDTPHYETVRQPLQAAAEELKHLTELADRFSQLAKLPEPKVRPTDLNRFLTTMADLYADRLSDYDFKLDLPSQAVIANIDETYFREVLHNLLQNAIEASEAGGQISITLASEPDTARLTVEDRGRGMDKETALSARMPYFTTKSGGSGIGLAMVDKIVNELGGGVFIDSEPNRGTTITINLPLGEPHD